MINKKLKPLDLTASPNRDLIVTPSTDQAALSNQIKVIPPSPDNNFSKEDYIKFIEGMITTISTTSKDPQTLQLIPVLEFAKREIGKCTRCLGNGKFITYDKPQNDYIAKTSPKGKKYFLANCIACAGTGKQLDVRCASCGKDGKIMPDQSHFEYCANCEARLMKSGVLL
jgi:hypothetical protein